MTVLCIAGMHRSGTSMVTKLLNLGGVYLGPEEDIYAPASDNPDGFWENVHFVKINNQILEHFGGAWDAPPNFPDNWESSPELDVYRLLASDLFKQFKGHLHWGWKDPRSSLTINFWKSLIPGLKVVVCVRNPLEVYRSLNRRGYSSHKFAFNLWKTYYDSLLSAVPIQNRIVTHFDSFFINPKDELIRILDFSNMSTSGEDLENAINSIKTGLRHNSASNFEFLKYIDSYDLLDIYQKLCDEAGPNYQTFLDNTVFYSEESFYNYKDSKPNGVYKELIDATTEAKILKRQLHEAQLQTQFRFDEYERKLQQFRGVVFVIKKYVMRNFNLVGEYSYKIFKGLSNYIHIAFNILFNEGISKLLHRLRKRLKFIIYPPAQNQINESNTFADIYSNFFLSNRNSDTKEYVPIFKDNFEGTPPVKLIAFYLPQFHPIPENDEWWGKGFTEWTNVTKAVPQFVGHYQPHLPGELGFYDLRIKSVQHRQVELARKYGISGFCFYYYWFHGKRLLETPLEQFINDKDIDFPFCVCWANENWTRRWDGQENEILIGQEYSPESDLQFIKDVAQLFLHKNYIHINGRPVLIVYLANILPNPSETVEIWKDYCKSIGLAEPYLIAAQTFFFEDPTKIKFDAAVQFPPHSKSQENILDKIRILNPDYKGVVINYSDAWPIFGEFTKKIPYKLFRTVFPSWDNEPRKPGRGYTFAFSTPEEYQLWLVSTIQTTISNFSGDERIVFINAWNEWAEGAHLEPDRKFGYAYLQATYNALRKFTTE